MSAGLRFLDGDPLLRPALAALLRDEGAAQASLSVLREQPGHRRLLRAHLGTGDVVFLKRFTPGKGRLREAVKRTLGLEAARREWRALVSLHARGVRVPEPLALIALEHGERVIATRFLEGRTLKQTLAESTGPPEQRRALLHAVGELVASLHQAGWRHGDLHHGNLLVGKDGVWLLDLQAALPLRGAAARWRDLGELDHSLSGSLSLADRVRLRARALGFSRPFSAAARRSLRAAGRAALGGPAGVTRACARKTARACGSSGSTRGWCCARWRHTSARSRREGRSW